MLKGKILVSKREKNAGAKAYCRNLPERFKTRDIGNA